MDTNARLEFQRLRQMADLSLEEAATLTFVSERQARRYEDITEAGCDPSPLALEALRRAARWDVSARATGTRPANGQPAQDQLHLDRSAVPVLVQWWQVES